MRNAIAFRLKTILHVDAVSWQATIVTSWSKSHADSFLQKIAKNHYFSFSTKKLADYLAPTLYTPGVLAPDLTKFLPSIRISMVFVFVYSDHRNMFPVFGLHGSEFIFRDVVRQTDAQTITIAFTLCNCGEKINLSNSVIFGSYNVVFGASQVSSPKRFGDAGLQVTAKCISYLVYFNVCSIAVCLEESFGSRKSNTLPTV